MESEKCLYVRAILDISGWEPKGVQEFMIFHAHGKHVVFLGNGSSCPHRVVRALGVNAASHCGDLENSATMGMKSGVVIFFGFLLG